MPHPRTEPSAAPLPARGRGLPVLLAAILGSVLGTFAGSPGLRGDEDAGAPPPAVDLPLALDPETSGAIAELDHADWRRREAATAWLVVHADRWARRVPAGWSPAGAEGRWRWERVVERVAALEALPTALLAGDDPRAEARLAALREETGTAFIDALERCLSHPDARVRRAAIERLGGTAAGRARLGGDELASDRSPLVREHLYEIARLHDRDRAVELLARALAREEDPRQVGVAAEAARRLGDPRLLPDLRRRFRGEEEPNAEVVIALAAFGRDEDADAVDRLLRSSHYRQVSIALDSLGSRQFRRHEAAIEGLLVSEHWDLRVRALRRLEEEERAAAPYRLLPLLEHPDEEVYLFAVENLARLGGDDFMGDIEASLGRFPPGRRPFEIATEGGRTFPRAVASAAGPVPALAPGED